MCISGEPNLRKKEVTERDSVPGISGRDVNSLAVLSSLSLSECLLRTPHKAQTGLIVLFVSLLSNIPGFAEGLAQLVKTSH